MSVVSKFCSKYEPVIHGNNNIEASLELGRMKFPESF